MFRLFSDLQPFNCPLWSFVTTGRIRTTAPYIEDFEVNSGEWTPVGDFSTWAYGTPNKPLLGSNWTWNIISHFKTQRHLAQRLLCLEVTVATTIMMRRVTFTHHQFQLYNLPIIQSCYSRWTWTLKRVLQAKLFWWLGYDGLVVEYSDDYESTWNVLGSTSSPNWYMYSSVDALGSNCFSGSSNGWKSYSHVIPNIIGTRNCHAVHTN